MFSFKTYSFDKNNIKIDKINFTHSLSFVTSKIPNDDDPEIVKFIKASSYFHCKANNIDVNDSDIEFEFWSKHFKNDNRSYNIHLDKDETLFENNSFKMHKEVIDYATNNDVFPILTICSYFDDVDEPVVILNAGSDTLSHKLQYHDKNLGLDSPNFPTQPAIASIFPKKNTQVIFKGGTFLHGCIPFNDDNIVKDRRIVITNIWKRKIMKFHNKPHKNFLELPQKIFEVMPDNLRQCIYSKNHNEMKKIIENMHETDSLVWTNRLSKFRIWDSQTGFDKKIIKCDFSSYDNYYKNRIQNDDIAKKYENHYDDYMVPTEFKLNLCKQTTNDSKLLSKFLTYNQHIKPIMTFQNLFNIASINRDNYYLLLFQPDIHFPTNKPYKLKLLSVATDKKHTGFQNFMYSVNKCNVPHKILGLDTEWKGGDMENGPGGGYKINLLKKELKTWTTDELRETILLFTDSYDVILLNNQYEILNKYYNALNNYDYANTILFSCEKSCWPDSTLQKDYPNVFDSSYLYLNSGSFIGNAMNIKNLICEYNINDNDDDQLFFTNIFLKHRLYIRCQLDYWCLMFQTLNNSIQDITIMNGELYNSTTSSSPSIIHGNGPQENKLFLNYIFSYFKDINKILYKNTPVFKTLYDISSLSIPTFIINMKRNIDRKKSMIEKIKYTGLNNFKFVKAIDGKTDLCNHNFKVQDNTNINIGEIGCFLSHSKTWEYIVDNNIEYALILEDDTTFNTCFNFYMNYIMQNIHLYKSYDLIKINNFRNINNESCLDNIMLKVNYIYNASSYIISKNGAKKIMELKPNENIIAVDDYLSQINQCKFINTITTKFNLCDQEYRYNFPSTIIGTKQYNNIESNYKLDSFFTKFIHTVSFTVPSKTCSEIIDKLNNTLDYTKQDDSLMSCNSVIINENDESWNQIFIINENDESWNKIYIDIKKLVEKSFLEYINIFPNAWCPDEVMVIPEITLKKYEKNKGHFNQWHNDYYFDVALKEKLDKLPITTSFLIYLNDVSNGGETEFMQGTKIKPSIGKIILFPAAFPYFHRGLIPRSDDKYIMNGWIVAGQNPDISI